MAVKGSGQHSMSALTMSRSQALTMLDNRDTYDDEFLCDAAVTDEYIDTLPRYAGMSPESLRIHPIESLPRNAWMSPDGTLYGVDDVAHSHVAYSVFNDDRWGDGLEERGWLHISVGMSLYITCSHPSFTQAQLDTLWDMYMVRPDHPVAWQRDAIAQLRSLLHITIAE